MSVLGGLAAERDGRPVAWRRPADADLVALLALEPTGRLSREEVARRLWPTSSPREAAKELEHAVKGVRKVLHDDRAVTVEGDDLRLWPHGALTVDVHLFLARAKHAHRDEQRAEALALWTGEVIDRPWAAPLRARARLTLLALQRDLYGEPEELDLREPEVARA